MRVVSLRDQIVWPIVDRMGYNPAADLLVDMVNAYARWVNGWVRKCWDLVDWPELSLVEPRVPVNHLIPYDGAGTFGPQWNQLQTYNKDSVVIDPANLQNVYISIQNANTNHLLSDASWWAQVSAWDKTKTYLPGNTTTPSATIASLVCDPVSSLVYVAVTTIQPNTVIANSLQNPAAWQLVYSQQQAQQQQTNIGRLLKVYLVDPSVNDGPFDIPFTEYATAFHVGFFHGTTVWVKFMGRPPKYSLTAWSSTTTYNSYLNTDSVNDLAYDINVGECYLSLQNNNLNRALPGARSSNAFWQWIPFPYVLADVVSRGVYSDALRSEGQTQKAGEEEQAALQELQLAVQRNSTTRYDKLTDQQTGLPRYVSQVAAGAA